jgi:hypothetical protein
MDPAEGLTDSRRRRHTRAGALGLDEDTLTAEAAEPEEAIGNIKRSSE